MSEKYSSGKVGIERHETSPAWPSADAAADALLASKDAELATLRTRLSTLSQSNAVMVAALREGLRIASDENGEVFGGDLAARDTAIIAWKQQARAAIAGQGAGVVCVKRDLLERAEMFIASHVRPGPVEPACLAELRALLGEGGK